jgi:hypothetical protein
MVAQVSVTLSVGTLLCPYGLPTVGSTPLCGSQGPSHTSLARLVAQPPPGLSSTSYREQERVRTAPLGLRGLAGGSSASHLSRARRNRRENSVNSDDFRRCLMNSQNQRLRKPPWQGPSHKSLARLVAQTPRALFDLIYVDGARTPKPQI